MKTKHLSVARSVLGLAGLALAGALSLHAQTLPLTYTFDSGKGSWDKLWYLSSGSVDWDGSRDANSNLNSGSIRCQFPMNGSDGGIWGNVDNGWPWDYNKTFDNSAGAAVSLSCDLRVDPSTPLTQNGDYGWWHLQLLDPSGNWTDLGDFQLGPDATNWTHISKSIKAGQPNQIWSFLITMWGGSGFTGPLIFNMDNLTLEPAAPAVVQLLNATYTAGVFQFTATNLVSGASYAVESSTNLTDWSFVSSFMATDTSLNVGDSPTSGTAQKFYRVTKQ